MNSKDLIGNLFLAEACKNVSGGKYEFFLAQNKQQIQVSPKHIKDQDLMGLFESKVAIFAFDGVELDSGTVVEFMQAKALDIPSVVYRTDFRGGSGEQSTDMREDKEDEEDNKWNLMVSNYPRTKVIYMNAMAHYQRVYREVNGGAVDATTVTKAYCESMAQTLCQAMDEVMATPVLLDEEEKQTMMEQSIKLMGINAP